MPTAEISSPTKSPFNIVKFQRDQAVSGSWYLLWSDTPHIRPDSPSIIGLLCKNARVQAIELIESAEHGASLGYALREGNSESHEDTNLGIMKKLGDKALKNCLDHRALLAIS